MKKWEKIAFVAVAVVALLIPVYTMPFMKQASTAEKRELATFPTLFDEGAFNTGFFAGVGDYLADHFSFRSPLVDAQSFLKGAFGVSSQEDVVMGRDGWLYFADTLPDYVGETSLTAGQAARLQRVGDLMAEYVESHGASFALTVVPNKATLYPQYMPYYYRIPQALPPSKDGGLSPLHTLNTVLKEEDWYVDMTAALTAEEDTLLYHKRDSHWNNLGARVGYDALMAAVGGKAGAYADTPYAIQAVWDGDLDGLLRSSATVKDDQAVWQTEFTYEYTSRFRNEEDILITTACTTGEGHLVMFRDSFGNALLPLLAQQYATATFSRALPFALDLTEIEEADTVLVEIVERNLANLLAYAPKMAAPLREMPPVTDRGDYVQANVAKSGNYIKVSGLTDGMADRLYLAVEGVAYEASPIAEGDATADNGFTAYLPADCYGKTITLLGEYQGVWTDLGAIH